ncbi:retrovirus-related pol polyprotein from transposon TNT 1-94 [Tanacetum coccineum]
MTLTNHCELRLKDRLYTFRMKPGTSVQDHLDEFNNILIDLENLDVDIDDEDKAVLLVISLPASYKHFKEIMLYGNRETLSFDDVKSALLSKQKYDDDVELEREGKGNNEKKPEKTAEIAIAKGDSDGDVYMAIDTENSRDELIVDSGCTFHMIPHRSWFTTYESFNGGNVYIGNHSICLVIGKGNIQVKMHDGVVRTITGVRHVPDLKRNLISLSTLEANGCKYSGEGGVMKIFKGALVLMKVIQSGGLYVLQGTVVYGTAVVATSKASLDDSKLWHYRLGHMGEKGMKTRDALDYIHSDLWGPSPATSRGGKRYMLTIIDDFSRKVWFFFLKHKDEVFPTFKEWKVLIENQTGKKIKKLRTDNGLEFCGESFNALCRKYGIARHHTLVRTPQQNGVAEIMNRTIMEKVRCMLSHPNLDKNFWVEAATTAAYLINRSPHRSLDGNIPEILWSVPRAVKCIFLGYGSGVKGYRVWCPDPKYRNIIHSRDVTFNEDVIINSGKDFVPPHNVDYNHTEGKMEFEFDVENSTHTQPPFNDEHIETQDDGNMPTSPQSQPQTEYLLARDRERRQVNRPPRLKDYQCDLVAYAFAAAAHIEGCEPTNYFEAISSPECDKWVVAMKEEFKYGIPGVESKRYKARYVVRGFDQREGIDFNEVFSPVVRHTSIRVLLSIVALQDLELEQLDVKTAFLHGHLEEEIYVEQPEGFKVPGKEDHVCRLKKSLYGLKQSPRQWYKRFDSFMIGHGYDRCSYDECVYLRKFPDGSFLYLSEEDKEDMSRVPYIQACGKIHWEAVNCILRYLKGTSNIGLSFEKSRASPNGVVGYVDSDYAGDLDARKSLSSYIFSHCGSAISCCKNLQENGHIVSDCYKLKNKLEREGKGNNKKKPEKPAEVAITKGDFDGDIYLAIDIEKSKDELIVDSGCTFHMIPHRSWFTTYESFNGGNIYIGNHSICPVIGKGNIQVKMHNGVVRTIAGYSGEGGVMKIFKGALVLMKAIQSGGLYVLQGTVVYGTAGVATSKASLDDSKLWHYRLGHMGEKGMKYLAKKGLIKVSCIERGMLLTTFILIYGGHLLLRLEEHKDEVFPTFKEWKVLIENQTGKKIKKLRTDNGLEFCGESFNALCRKYGIARHHTLVRTPQQNGVAERMNRTIMEKVRCMLSHANLDKDFWVEAATTATYLINRSPHRSLDGNIPEILWSGNLVDYSNLRVFRCPVYVHVNEGKLVPRVVKCIFLGYGSGVKGYRVWCPDPKYRKIIHSRDVTFNEDVIINSGKDFVPPHNVDNNHTEGKVEFEFDVENSTHTQPPFNDEHIETQDDVAYAFAAAAHIEGCEPTNYFEAISSPECDKWVVAMKEEVESLHKNETWELVKLPKEKRVISCKWLFKVKDGIPGVESKRYKARYVVRGFDQREGIDFNEVFSPVVRHTSIRVLLSIVALQDLELEQLDVKTAFLHGHLEEEIYVEQPEGFKVPGKEDHVCRLKKSLYGLKQSPRQWYKRRAVGSKIHWEAVKCILRYLKGTSNIGLSFEKSRASPNGVVGYVDSDYAGDLDARKSLSSYIFSHCGSAISCVVHLTKNNKFHSKIKHIEVRHHFVRDIIEKGEVIVDKIHTNDNPADMLTKVLTPTKFKHCLDLVGVIGV